jgi:hypothetical protein
MMVVGRRSVFPFYRPFPLAIQVFTQLRLPSTWIIIAGVLEIATQTFAIGPGVLKEGKVQAADSRRVLSFIVSSVGFDEERR